MNEKEWDKFKERDGNACKIRKRRGNEGERKGTEGKARKNEGEGREVKGKGRERKGKATVKFLGRPQILDRL